MDTIFHRTSIRKYLEQKVENDKITEILRAAMAAPSAGNQQPWEFYVVREKQKLQQLAGTSPYAGCTADALGLGAVWLGIAPLQERMDAVRKILGIPEELEVFAIVPCGYPGEEREQQDRFENNRIHYVD